MHMIDDDCPCYRKNSNLQLEHSFSKCFFFLEFRMKQYMDIEILYVKFFIITKYCSISNNNVDTVVIDMNNVESSIASNSSKEEYNVNNNNDRNSVVNNNNSIDSENRNINISDTINNKFFTNSIVNRTIGENRVNIINFLSNECVNIYVSWYRLCNILLGVREYGYY